VRRPPSISFLLLVACLIPGACSVAGGHADRILARTETAGLSDRAVHAWVDEYRRSLVRQFRDIVFAAYDAAEDLGARQRAIFLGLFVERETARAAQHADAFVAMVDIHTLVRQLARYFEDGEGAAAFPGQRDEILRVLAIYDRQGEVGLERVADPELRRRAGEVMDTWVAEWPIVGHRLRRVSTVPMLVELFGDQEEDVFDRVASIEETAERIETRIADMTYDLPVQVGLEAILLIDSYLERLHGAGLLALAERLVALLEGLPAWGAEQRRESLAALDAMRADTLAVLAHERTLLVETFAAERIRVVEALGAERLAALAEVDRQRGETVDALAALVTAERAASLDAVESMRRATLAEVEERAGALIDRVLDGAFWRGLAMLGIAGFAAGAGFAVLRRGPGPG
jgi:hypothetical protein